MGTGNISPSNGNKKVSLNEYKPPDQPGFLAGAPKTGYKVNWPHLVWGHLFTGWVCSERHSQMAEKAKKSGDLQGAVDHRIWCYVERIPVIGAIAAVVDFACSFWRTGSTSTNKAGAAVGQGSVDKDGKVAEGLLGSAPPSFVVGDRADERGAADQVVGQGDGLVAKGLTDSKSFLDRELETLKKHKDLLEEGRDWGKVPVLCSNVYAGVSKNAKPVSKDSKEGDLWVVTDGVSFVEMDESTLNHWIENRKSGLGLSFLAKRIVDSKAREVIESVYVGEVKKGLVFFK